MISIVYIISCNNHIAFVWFISYIFIDNKIDIREKKYFSYIFLYLVSYICEIIWFYIYFDYIVKLEYGVKYDLICIILLVLYTKQLAFYAYVNHMYVSLLVTGPLFDTATKMSNQPPGLSNCPFRKSKSISILWRCSVCK